MGELSRLFEAESQEAPTRHEKLRLQKISGELYAKAMEKRRQEVRDLLSGHA